MRTATRLSRMPTTFPKLMSFEGDVVIAYPVKGPQSAANGDDATRGSAVQNQLDRAPHLRVGDARVWRGSCDPGWFRGGISEGRRRGVNWYGLFGAMITLTAFRRLERWAFFSLWYYPVFWTAHLVGNLPPGRDHIHQVAFIVLSLIGLLLPVREFFPRSADRT